ncbi:MAG: flippase [Nitrososphaeria archaeon]
MNTSKRIIKNTFSLLLSGVGALFFSFISIVYLARTLGPGDFGKINFALAVISYFNICVDFGLPLIGTRELARNKEKIGEYAGSILLLRFLLAVVSFISLLILAYFLNQSPEVKKLLILYGIGLFFTALLTDWVYQGLEKMEYIGLGRILSAIFYMGLVLYFVKKNEQLLLVPCFQIIGYLLSAGLLFWLLIKYFCKPQLKNDFVLWKYLLHQALPVALSIFMIQVIYNADTVMLGLIKGSNEVGYYNAAYKIIMVLILSGATYFDATFPIISNYYQISLESLKGFQSHTARLILIISLPLGVGGTILAKPIISLIYGTEYTQGIVAFEILIWVVVLIYINMIYARGLWACNKQNEYLKIVATQAAANVILNVFMIPLWGLKGAAFTTLIAEAIGLFWYYSEFKKIVQVPLSVYVLKPFFASILMGLFLYWGCVIKNLNLFLLISMGVVIYLFVIFLVKGITLKDLNLIKGHVSGEMRGA